MSRKAKHNAKIRARILRAAAAAFCEAGYAGAGIDRIMGDAGLTRGAFYVHFPSKAGLFRAVLAEADPITEALTRRSEAVPDALWVGFCHLMRACLAPHNVKSLSRCWVLAALMREAEIQGPEAREAWETGLNGLVAEGLRGAPSRVTAFELRRALMAILGTFAVVGAIGADRARDATLLAAERELSRWIDAVSGVRSPKPSYARIGYRSGSSKTSKTMEPA